MTHIVFKRWGGHDKILDVSLSLAFGWRLANGISSTRNLLHWKNFHLPSYNYMRALQWLYWGNGWTSLFLIALFSAWCWRLVGISLDRSIGIFDMLQRAAHAPLVLPSSWKLWLLQPSALGFQGTVSSLIANLHPWGFRSVVSLMN